jgi:hypothetical protein
VCVCERPRERESAREMEDEKATNPQMRMGTL